MSKEKLVWHNEKRKVSQLIAYKINPRKLSEKAKKDLKTSLEKFNLVEVPAINTDNVILAGHQRLHIMALLGRTEEEIDVRVPNRPLDEKEFKEYNVRSNKNTGEWDYDVLSENFGYDDLIEWGFESKEIDKYYADKSRHDEDTPEVPETPTSEQGDIWTLGMHKVMCGDSCKQEDWAKLMGELKADMIFTDPPYNVNYEGSGKKTTTTIMNDKMDDEKFQNFLDDAFARLYENGKPSAVWYVCHSAKAQMQFELAVKNNHYQPKTQIIWVKPSAGLGMNEYRPQHEIIFYCTPTEAKKVEFYGDRTNTTVWDHEPTDEDIIEYMKKQIKTDSYGVGTIWRIGRDNVQEYEHPTQKPVALVTRAIQNSSKSGDVVVDAFGGSGTTLISAHKNNRIARVMELDPRFVDVIVARWIKWKIANAESFHEGLILRNGEPVTKELIDKFSAM